LTSNSNITRESLLQQISQIDSAKYFERAALSVFRYQSANNPLYERFLDLLSINPSDIQEIEAIPFLPISLFKTHLIKSGEWESQSIFTSSGTSGQVNSQHHLRDKNWYNSISLKAFEYFYGPVKDYCILALLPSYLERSGSSLVFMVQEFIEESKYPQSGFFLNHQDDLTNILQKNKKEHIPTLLIGVSFALLDFAEDNPQDLSHCVIMETGGMKGRRKEITRMELHQILGDSFGSSRIHSEYGMTELLSQSYSKGKGLFYPGPSKKVFCRELTDPFQLVGAGRSGGLNVIDLGNIDTCSFIATDDVGRVYADGGFEVMGRMDGSEMRGCSLMIEE
jgi:hypothetical protein